MLRCLAVIALLLTLAPLSWAGNVSNSNDAEVMNNHHPNEPGFLDADQAIADDQQQQPLTEPPSGSAAPEGPTKSTSSWLGYEIVTAELLKRPFYPGHPDPWCRQPNSLICANEQLLRCTHRRKLRRPKRERSCGRHCTIPHSNLRFQTGEVAFCLTSDCQRRRRPDGTTRRCDCLRCRNGNFEIFFETR